MTKQVRLPLYNAPPRIVGDCDGAPGACLVFSCAENVTLRVTRAGSIHVPGTHLYLPLHATSDRTVAPEVRALYATEDDPLTDAVCERVDWLVGQYGSTCWRDVRRALGVNATQEAIGRVWCVSSQAVSLWECEAREAIKRAHEGEGE